MARTYGFIACTTLVVASVWVANSSAPVETLEAGSGPGGQGLFQVRGTSGDKPMSAGDYLELGKRHYQVGESAEAVEAFKKAQSAPGQLTMFERNDLKRYLARARRDLDEADGEPGSMSSDSSGAYVIAKQMLDEARAHAARGDVNRAMQLAERANALPVKWKADELSPGHFLRELRAGKDPREIGKEFADVPRRADKGREPAEPDSVSPDDRFVPQINPRRVVGDAAAPVHDPRTHDAVIHPAGQDAGIPQAKMRAVELVRQARSDLIAGRYDQARAKAAQAQQLDVSWGLFEDQPEQVLKAVERRSGLVKLERNIADSQSPARIGAPAMPFDETPDEGPAADQFAVADVPADAGNVTADLPEEQTLDPRADDSRFEQTTETIPAPRGIARNNALKEQAAELLRQAKSDARAGRFESARQKVAEADELDVGYGIFDERPSLVAQEIDRLAPSGALAQQKPAALPPLDKQPPSAVAPGVKRNAQQNEKVQALLADARRALQAGRLDEARQKTEEAAGYDVVYGIFDDRPELVLAYIEIAERDVDTMIADNQYDNQYDDQNDRGTVELARPAAAPVIAASATGDDPRTARELLRAARNDIGKGRYEAARQKALQARDLQADYDPFDDRPDNVLADLDRLAARGELVERPQEAESPSADGNAPAVAKRQDKQKAKELLGQARVLLEAGRTAEARRKALEASRLNVAYDLFDERPEQVLALIDRADQHPPGGQGGSTTAQHAADESDLPLHLTDRRVALVLLKQARQDISAGRLDEARRKAREAQQLKTTYTLLDDRPEKVLEEIDRLLAQNPPAEPLPDTAGGRVRPNRRMGEDPFVQNIASQTLEPVDSAVDEPADEPDQLRVVHPSGVSALELYNRGLLELRQGHRDAAYTAFLEAYRSGQQLDPHKMQQLQDFVRTLRPAGREQIRLASGEADGGPAIGPAGGGEPGGIDIVERQMAVKFDRLRTEMLNAIFRAERLKEKNPDAALNVLEQAMARVESSDLPKESVGPLLRQLQNSKQSIQGYMKQHEPILALKSRNAEVEAEIRRTRETEIRVEQDLAQLVDEYNNLFRQRRYAEAEVLAKRAEDLQPDNPVVVTMVWKARFARRIQRDDEIRDLKEDSFVRTMQSVDAGVINPVVDSPMDFGDPKEWKELTNRRLKYGAPDNRRRSEQEQRIENSLNRQISLHFDEAPISEVMKHVHAVTDINIVLDGLGLQDEGVTTDQPVTIHVDGIMLKSALNLLLKPMHLAYTIEDEVLKVTSRMREQGQAVVVTYPVADLVVPIPNFNGHSGALDINSNGMQANSMGGGFGNMSVPSSGGLQHPAGAHFQVNDPTGGVGADPWSSPGMNARTSGGGSAADFGTLASLITQTIEPESWNEYGGSGGVIAFETTLSLVIRQTQKVHDEIRDLLEQLRRLQDLQVTIEVRFITVADRFFERIGVDFDFNVQDTVGSDPTAPPFGQPLGSLVNQQGQQGQGQNGNGGGGIMGGSQAGNLLPFPMGLQGSNPAVGMGGIGGQQQQGQQQQGQQQQGQMGEGFFDPPNPRALTAQDNWPKGGTIVGLSAPGQFTPDLDISFRQGSFDIGVPDFGGFNPDAGIQVGLAILSDIEAFFFIQAAQGDERSNLLFAPKVTLFNGQLATVSSQVQRPFVTSLIPTVGFFSVGFTPQITVIPEGVSLTVQAVISADRRFVRLTVFPQFSNITDVFTFSFVSGGGGGAQQGIQGLGGGAGGVVGGGGLGGIGGGGLGGLGGGGLGGIGGIGGLGGGLGGIGGVGGVGGGQVGQQGQQGQQGQLGAGAAGNITVQQPVLESVTVTTTVSVPDGGTVLLGGIKRLREGRNMAGVPILNKIPYISRLFKNTGVGRETESLMLMVTPRIIIQEEEEELLGIPQD